MNLPLTFIQQPDGRYSITDLNGDSLGYLSKGYDGWEFDSERQPFSWNDLEVIQNQILKLNAAQ